MKELNLQQFAGSLTVTVLKDGNVSTATATPSSSLAKDDEVELELAFASGYELAEIEVVSGGVTPVYDETDGWGFVMGAADVVLYVKSKKDNLYKVMENTWVWVNGTGTELKRNIVIERSANGGISGVSCTPAEVTVSASVVDSLVEQGVLVKV